MTQCNAEKFVKKLFGENEVEAVLQRLDRLNQEEARTTAAQTLEVVYGLVQNMRVVIDGKRIHLTCLPLAVQYLPCRRQGLSRQCPRCSWWVLLTTMS
jgi:hypothetical protein